MAKPIDELRTISVIPEDKPGEWLESAEQSVEFLKSSFKKRYTILYACMRNVLIHAALAPLSKLNPPDKKDLSNNFISLGDGWVIEHASGGGKPDRVYLDDPLRRIGRTFEGGEKLVFQRSFAGAKRSPIEISQKLIHALDLHFVEERKAYCRLDEHGDIEDVINVNEVEGNDFFDSETVVTILSKDLAEYMRLAEMGLVTFFDFTRFKPGSFNSWNGQRTTEFNSPDLFYHGGIVSNASYVNGRIITRPAIELDEIVKEHMERRNPTNLQYATFKAVDLETLKQIEVSCDPAKLRNYFQPKSDLPLGMSFAFFNPEVFTKYKNDSEKYQLEDRSVSCRGTWSLKTFDVNEAGQVHTYLVYLGDLPYREQLYWQSFNEWPKAPLSRRAIQTDFQGHFSTQYDSLVSLKRKLKSWDDKPPMWWKPRGKELHDEVRYPATNSISEWGDELLALDQLLVEGFLESKLRKALQSFGGKDDRSYHSLKLLEECLKAKGLSEEDARNTMRPLRRLHELRTTMKGHSAGSAKADCAKKAKTQFGSFRGHFEKLAEECDSAVDQINELLFLFQART